MDAGALRAEEDSNEDHGDFAEHHHALPVVGALLVALVEEPVSLHDLLVHQTRLVLSEEAPGHPRDPHHPQHQAEASPEDGPVEVLS